MVNGRPRIFWPFLEASVLVGAVVLVNRTFFPDDLGFKNTPFSLFWFPILFIAGKYSTASTLYTGILCSFCYLLLSSMDRILLGVYTVSERDKVIIFMYIFIALLLGQMFDKMRLRLAQLDHDHEELKSQFENLRTHHDSLQLANTELEKRLIGRQSTFHSLYEMAKNLESIDEQTVLNGVIELLLKFVSASKVCIYLRNAEGRQTLVRATGYTQQEFSRLSGRVETNSLLSSACRSTGAVSFLQGHEEQMKQLEPVIMAVPVRIAAGETPIGLISVDEMPFLAIHAANMRLLGIISDWAGQNISKARSFKDLQNRELDDQLTGVFSYAFFKARVHEELSRAQRHCVVVTLMMLRISEVDRMSEENRKDLMAIIGLVFANLIRDVDIACRFKDSSTFVLLLPLTESVGATILANKLRSNIENYKFKPFDNDDDLRILIAFETFRAIEGRKPIYSLDDSTIEEFIASVERRLTSA